PWLPRALPVGLRHPDRAPHFLELVALSVQIGCDVQGLAHCEETHRDDDHVDAVEQLRNAKSEARLCRLRIEPDQADRQTEEQTRESPHRRSTQHCGYTRARDGT